MPITVTYGLKDDRISLQSMQWLEGALANIELKILAEANHNLMTDASVMFDVLTRLSDVSLAEAMR